MIFHIQFRSPIQDYEIRHVVLGLLGPETKRNLRKL